jgi:hypothetical protein
MADFVPKSDDTLNTWLNNFKNKLAQYAATLNVSADDLAIYQNQCDALSAAILEVNNFRKTMQQKVQGKDELRFDTVSNIRTIANRIKTEPNYTQAIGNDLGIVSSDSIIDWTVAKPQLNAAITGGHVVLTFKRGQSNGIKIYSKRAGENAFSFLALDTHSPYHDNRPNLVEGVAEVRQYYAYFVDGHDEQVGIQSDTVNISV